MAGDRGYPDAASPRGYVPRTFDTSKTVYAGNLLYDRIYVGGLRDDTDERTVRKWFEAYGPVASVKLIYDKDTGRSKGFGFVSFESERDARDALNDANGRDLDGASIRVNYAHGPAPQGGHFAGRGRGRPEWGSPPPPPPPPPYRPGSALFDSPRHGSGPLASHGGGSLYSPSPRSAGGPPERSWGAPYGARGVPYRPPFEGRGIDRRLPPGGHERDRYSPGRYSPRSRSPRSRSRTRSPAGRRHEERGHRGRARGDTDTTRHRFDRSASRGSRGSSLFNSSSSGGSPTPSGSRRPRSPAFSPDTTLGAGAGAAAAVDTAAAAPPAAAAPRAGPAASVGATAAPKAPPSAEAIKKEMMRLRRAEKELGGRVRALQDELARRDRQLAQREHQLAEAQAEAQALAPQLARYQGWTAALMSGAARLASSRTAAAAAESEVRLQQEALAALHSSIQREAAQDGLEVGGRHIAEDDDAVWEQLAADIQASEQVQRAEHGHAGEGRSSAEGHREGAPAPQAPPTAAPQQRQQQQEAVSDEQLQAAMQEAAMEDDEAAGNGNGWAPVQDGGGSGGGGSGRWAGLKIAVPA